MAERPTTIQPVVPHPSVDERRALGRSVRKALPRRELGAFSPAPDRDPIGILTDQESRRVPELVPLRHERMAASPFAFYRGAAAIFAADLADAPRTGLRVQLCGDAHLANFGGFASPERTLVFDINDFDETLPGPFEWDVKRLAASFEVAGRSNGLDATPTARPCSSPSPGLRRGRWAASPAWTTSTSGTSGSAPTRSSRTAARGRPRRCCARFAADRRQGQGQGPTQGAQAPHHRGTGELRFLSDPPLLQPVHELMSAGDRDELIGPIHEALQSYRRTLQPDRRRLLERYRFVDLARKVVGVGSVGTRCWVALLRRPGGRRSAVPPGEGGRGVGARAATSAQSVYPAPGPRVVEGQRLDAGGQRHLPRLGARRPGSTAATHDYYFRQLWDWKASADIDTMSPDLLGIYAKICGVTLARAHARTGDAVADRAVPRQRHALGRGDGRFSSAYADQNERDHAAAVAAWGTAPTTPA